MRSLRHIRLGGERRFAETVLCLRKVRRSRAMARRGTAPRPEPSPPPSDRKSGLCREPVLCARVSTSQRPDGHRGGEEGVRRGLRSRRATRSPSAERLLIASTSAFIAAANTSRPSEYSSLNSTAPFSSITAQPSPTIGSRSTPTRSAPTAAAAAERELDRRARRIRVLALRSERDVRPPLALGGLPAHRADDLSGRDDDAQVVAERRNELLHEHAVRAEPRPLRDLFERLGQLPAGRAQHHVAAPRSEPGLEHDRKLDRPDVARCRRSGSCADAAGPAASSRREVWSLSCVAISALSGLRTRTPSFSRSPTSQLPVSIPSRLASTSRRAQRPIARAEPSADPRGADDLRLDAGGAASTSLRFVSLSLCATRATRMAAHCACSWTRKTRGIHLLSSWPPSGQPLHLMVSRIGP